MTAAYRGTPFYGMVPESISHEGYSAKPMHSYWDTFFILRGLKDAAFLASELQKPEAASSTQRCATSSGAISLPRSRAR